MLHFLLQGSSQAGIKPKSPALAGRFFTAEPLGKSKIQLIHVNLGFLSGSAVKNPPVMQELQEPQFPSLGGEGPLEEGVTAHSSILAWRIPQTEEPGGLQSIGSQSLTKLKRLSIHTRVNLTKTERQLCRVLQGQLSLHCTLSHFYKHCEGCLL